MSLLGIPTEARLLILKHLFSDSRIIIGSRYDCESRTTIQEPGFAILLTCKQVRAEGQRLLAKSTQLFIYCQDYTTVDVPTGVFLTYVLHIERLTLEIDEGFEGSERMSRYFDPRILPNLKVLNLIDTFGNWHERSMDTYGNLELDEWFDVLRGRNNSFLPEECVAQSQANRVNPCCRATRLTELALSVRPYNFKVFMHYTSRLTFDVYFDSPDGTDSSDGIVQKITKAIIVVSLHASYQHHLG